jgi:hypothetical protein
MFPIRLPRAGLVLPVVMVVAVAACGGADASSRKEPADANTVAAGATTAPAATAATETGVVYIAPEGDYRATFPTQPTEQTQSEPLPDGGEFDLKLVRVDLGNTSVATARGSYPEGYQIDAAVGLQGAQDQTIASLGGSLTGSREIALDGLPGREFSASVTSNGQGGTLLERVYLDGLTIYEVIRTGAGELSFSDPESVAFFDSFELTR